MKLNRKLMLVLALVLSVALATGGTLAYLTDTDDDVNVMTLGNVQIEQHEYERELDANGEYKTATIDNQTSYVLKDFTQGKPLLPATESSNYGAGPWDDTIVRMTQVDSYGGMQVFTTKNAQDKFVTVENTGKSDAYVRTLVAIEIGTGDADKLGTSYHQTWTSNKIGAIAIDENTYSVTEYIYNGAELDDGSWRHENGVLPAGDTTYPNLSQIYMKSEATNEDCEKLDGNGNGTLDILVVSQAVQAAGFSDAKTALDTAFGKPSAENLAAWFGGMYPETEVENGEDLQNALNHPGQVINMTEDVNTTNYTVPANSNATINLNGKTLNGVANIEGEVTVNGGTLAGNYVQNNGKATFTDVTMNTGTTGDYASINSGEDVEAVYNNVNMSTAGGSVAAASGAKVTFNSGSVTITGTTTSPRYVFYVAGAGSELTINGGTFDFTAKTLKRSYIYAGADTTVYVNGGTFGAASTRSDYTGFKGDGTIIVTGGTFGFDPSAWVADGYEAVQTGSTWTVSAQ